MNKSHSSSLLGHNGAGKTTTINLLTGMLQKTEGDIQSMSTYSFSNNKIVYGMDIDSDLEEIRTKIGLCCQKDVLYDNMTVLEHLLYVCKIKNIPEAATNAQIQDIIRKVHFAFICSESYSR